MSGLDTPRCSNCGSVEIDVDPARGDAACVDCGTVLEENAIVAEVGFQEDARGRSSAIGQHVNADGRPTTLGSLPGFSRAGTEITMSNARRRLWHMVSALQMAPRHAEAALRFFRFAVERNFHKGRKLSNVCCACLYFVCRIEKTHYMLIDFSDILETNVYVLGHTFLKFAPLTCIELPIIDPSLYIHRFASKLEFGDKTHAVAMSALRILARMRRDWMSHGRRPAGLCGAALIVAARMHNFHRTQADVVRVVRVGNVVLKERLNELNRTPTAHLTADQIDAGGGDDGKETSLSDDVPACDPPAFQRSLAKRKARMEKNKEKATNSRTRDKDVPESQRRETQLTVGGTGSSESRTTTDEDLEGEIQAALASKELQELEQESIEDEQQTIARAKALMQQASCSENEGTTKNDSAASAKDNTAPEKEPDDLSDLDDDDVAQYLNTEEEYERKKELWHEVNKEYLEQQELLEKMKAERPEEYKRLRPSRSSKKRKTISSGESEQGNSPSTPKAGTTEATQPRPPKSSSKLNYAVLESLGQGVGLGASMLRVSSARPPLPPRSSNG